MNVYIFSENHFFYIGLSAIIEKEPDITVRRVSIDLLVKHYNNDTLKESDVFLVAIDHFNMTLAALVVLDHLSLRNVFLLPSDTRALGKNNYFSSFLPDEINKEYLKDVVRGDVISKVTKQWQLTYRETIVMSHRLRGLDVRNVSRLLAVNTKTVYTHQRSALNKLGVRSMGHLHTL